MVIWNWKWLFFELVEFTGIPDKGTTYLVAIGHCSECHTPRDSFSVSDSRRYLAGTNNGTKGESVPNITPDRSTGIGKWSEDDVAYFLETGELPDGDYTGGLMAEVIDAGVGHLNSEDLKAMAAYLKSLPAIRTPNPVKNRENID